MIDVDATPAERAEMFDLLNGSHEMRIEVLILDRDEKVIDSLNVPASKVIEGEVTVDALADVTRSLSLTLLDENHRLHFDSDSPAAGAIYADRFIQVNYLVKLEDKVIRIETAPECVVATRLGLTDEIVDTAWFLDDNTIIFSSYVADDGYSASNVYTIGTDASGRATILNDGKDHGRLVISPSRDRIAYVDGSDLYIAHADGSNENLIYTYPGDTTFPSFGFSPDGSQFVFLDVADADTNDVYVCNDDGTGLTLVYTTGARAVGRPIWCSNDRIAFLDGGSPDESYIAFMDPDGTDVVQATFPTGADRDNYLLLSPDGNTIAYWRDNGELRTVDIDGTGDTLVATEPEFPAGWYADGGSIMDVPATQKYAVPGGADLGVYICDMVTDALGFYEFNDGGTMSVLIGSAPDDFTDLFVAEVP